jgi:hypothetical protein
VAHASEVALDGDATRTAARRRLLAHRQRPALGRDCALGHDHRDGPVPGPASLSTCFGSTVVILILVSLLPPNLSDNRLRFGTAPRATG